MNDIELKDQYRAEIAKISLHEPFSNTGHVLISEALIEAAFAYRFFGDGDDGVEYAASALHKLVDDIATAHKSGH